MPTTPTRSRAALISNEDEIDQIKRDMRRSVSVIRFDKDLGWLSLSLSPHSDSPFPSEPIKLIVEFPKGYPAAGDPLKFHFHQTKQYDHVKSAVQGAAASFQKTKRKSTNGRCLEDCLAYVCRALRDNETGGTPSVMTASSSYSDMSNAWPSSLQVLEEEEDVNSLLRMSVLSDESVNKLSRKNSVPMTILAAAGGVAPLVQATVVQEVRGKTTDEQFGLSGNAHLSSSTTMMGNQSVLVVAAGEAADPVWLRTRRCGASFGGNDRLVVFTSAPTSSSGSLSVPLVVPLLPPSPVASRATDDSKSSRVSVIQVSSWNQSGAAWDCVSGQDCTKFVRSIWKRPEEMDPLSFFTVAGVFAELENVSDIATLATLCAHGKLTGKDIPIPSPERYIRAYMTYLDSCGDFVSRIDLEKSLNAHNPLDLCFEYTPLSKKCSVCRLSFTECDRSRQLISVCFRCGHGGHVACLSSWFALEDACACGCGCDCVMDG